MRDSVRVDKKNFVKSSRWCTPNEEGNGQKQHGYGHEGVFLREEVHDRQRECQKDKNCERAHASGSRLCPFSASNEGAKRIMSRK